MTVANNASKVVNVYLIVHRCFKITMKHQTGFNTTLGKKILTSFWSSPQKTTTHGCKAGYQPANKPGHQYE